MDSIMAATYADVASTMYGLSKGGTEIGFFARHLFEQGSMTEAYAIKIGISAAFIAIYALTAKDSKTNDWA